MANKDKKTTFVTLWGTFCYKVMLIELKNSVDTDQQEMVALFDNMMHKAIEMYVDNMIAKSKEGEKSCPNTEEIVWKAKEI